MPSLLTLYENPDIAWDARAWDDNHAGLEAHLRAVQSIGGIATPNEFGAALDSLTPSSPERLPAAALLGSLDGPQLLYTFGERVTAWTIGNDAFPERSHLLTKRLENEGYNPTFLRWARALSREVWEKAPAPKSADVLVQNRLMEAITSTALQHVDLTASLQASRAGSIAPLKEKRLQSYGLVPLQIDPRRPVLYGRVQRWAGMEEHEKNGRSFPMYLDTPTGFALTYKGIPQFTVGVKASSPDELRIQQLQGVVGERWEKSEFLGNIGARGLPPLDWRKVGVHVAAQLAEKLGMRSVSIASSESIRIPGWTTFTAAEAKKAYDDTAERLGFAHREDRWVKPTADIIQG